MELYGPEEKSALQALEGMARWLWLTFRRAAWHSQACRLTRSSSACLLLSSSADLAMFSNCDRRLLVPLEAPVEKTADQACPVAPFHHPKHPGETQISASPRETCSSATFSCPSTQVKSTSHHSTCLPMCCHRGTTRPTASHQAQGWYSDVLPASSGLVFSYEKVGAAISLKPAALCKRK